MANGKGLTINEGMVWLKTLRERHAELQGLRNENSHATTRRYGVGGTLGAALPEAGEGWTVLRQTMRAPLAGTDVRLERTREYRRTPPNP